MVLIYKSSSEIAFSKQELEKLNVLVGTALVNRSIRQRLVHQRDATLQTEFGLTTDTWFYITSLRVSSLEDLCQAIIEIQPNALAS